jgi:DNA-binding transcriptional regulator YiaG
LVEPDAAGRIAAKEAFGEIVGGWLSRIPNHRLNEFLNSIFERCSKQFSEFHDDSDLKAVGEMQREMKQIEYKHRLVFLGNRNADVSKNDLTETESSGSINDVKALLPKLLERLNKASAAPGKKSELAKFLGVPLASVSRWLSGDREPGGEITLKLFHWVEQQERQK